MRRQNFYRHLISPKSFVLTFLAHTRNGEFSLTPFVPKLRCRSVAEYTHVIDNRRASTCGLGVDGAGQSIKNIYDYTYALDAVKIDVPVQVIVVREEKRLTMTMTPRTRK